MYLRSRRAQARQKIATLIAAGMALTGAITLAGAGAASAAEFDYPAAIDPASIVLTTNDGSGEVTVQELLRIDANWSVPDGALAGETFGFTLPTEFSGYTSSFSLPSETDPTQTVAECTVSADAPPLVTCTLTDYVDGRTGVKGALWFMVSVTEQTSESTVEFVVDGQLTPVVLPGGGIGPVGSLPEEPQKWSWQAADGRLVWQIMVPGSAFADADSLTIDDTLTPPGEGFAEHHNVDGAFRIWTTDGAAGDPQDVTDWTGGWNADGTAFHLEIAGPIDASRYYMVKYFTVPDAPAVGASFGNIVVINGVTLRSTEVWEAIGGGTGSGTTHGQFTLIKVLAGSGSTQVPADAVYTVTYTYGDPAVTQTVGVTAGGAVDSIDLPIGTSVTIEELAPPAVDDIVWGEPLFAGPGVTDLGDGRAQLTIVADATVQVTLTNTVTVVPVVTPPNPEVPTTPEVPTELPLTDGPHGLAVTGADAPLPLLWSGALLVGLGLIFAAAAQARRRAQVLKD